MGLEHEKQLVVVEIVIAYIDEFSMIALPVLQSLNVVPISVPSISLMGRRRTKEKEGP